MKQVTAGIVLQADNGHVWLVKDKHGYWGIPKGKQDKADPSPFHAALREVQEELQVAIDDAVHFGLGHTRSRRPLHAFLVTVDVQPVIADRREIKRLKLVHPDKALKLVHKGQKKILKQLKGQA